MKKLIFLALLCFTAGQVLSQLPTVKLRGDTIEILKNQGSAELAIRNSTRDTAGFLLNVGNGATQFHAPHRTNDSTIQIGPITIIIQAPGSTPGTNSGDTIYIAAAVDTFYTVPIGTAAGMIQTQYTISGPNFSEIRHSNWGPGLWTIPRLAADSLAYIDIDSAALRAYLTIAAGGVIITADNGLHKNTATNIRLGGALAEVTTIDVGSAYNMVFTGSGAGGAYVMDVYNSGTGTALKVENIDNAALVLNTVGSGYPLDVNLSKTSTNSSDKIANYFRSTSGTAAAGMGAFLNYQLKSTTNTIEDAVKMSYEWETSPVVATKTAVLKWSGATNGVMRQWMDVDGNGVISYGTGLGFQALSTATGIFTVGSIAGGVLEGEIIGIQAVNKSTSPNTTQIGLELSRQGSAFLGAVGEGISIQWDLKNAAGSNFNSGYIKHTLTDATAGAEGTDFEFFLNVAGLKTFVMKGGTQPTYYTIVPVYASNAAALAGGLVANDHYRNGDADMIVH